MKCCNNLFNMSNTNNFEHWLMKTYIAAKETDKNFVNIREKCLKAKKQIIKKVKEYLAMSNYAFAVDTMLQAFDSYSKLCIKNLTNIYKDNLEKVAKGDIHESNFD